MRLPPGPRPGILGLVTYPALRRNRLDAFAQFAREYGDIVYFKVGPLAFALLNHPNYVEDVLVTRARLFKKGQALERAKPLLGEGLLTSEGSFHLRQRRLVQPTFHKTRIATYADTMVLHARRTADRWQDGAELDIVGEMNRLTLTIVAETLFGADVEADAKVVRDALTDVFNAFTLTMSPFAFLLQKLPLPVVREAERSRKTLDRLIYTIIETRRRQPSDRGDLLSMLLLARDDGGTGSRMTDTQIRDEVMTLFLAGHETTANALAWTWYLLAQHPDVERRLHAEVDAVLGGRPATADDMARLPYTRMVFAESMRRYPPAWAVGRRALEDFTVGDYTIPKGTIVLVLQYLLHHDERFFPDPLRFDPDRWLPQRLAERPKYAYFPFGAGNRVCIGEPFAWMEGILLLATLARRWRLELMDSTPVPMQPVITLRPARPIRVISRARG